MKKKSTIHILASRLEANNARFLSSKCFFNFLLQNKFLW